ncbi:hypothetical protein EYF80_051563 [Liparis tanakae]|uniref:Uncharacterized protein n=1 Tax=Liparis tanakae TaxID=230148 RepID=A0A4Z2FAQ0_9TELE|nr:hypothetical protein EYF80_051563 [Liparis tanakae]
MKLNEDPNQSAGPRSASRRRRNGHPGSCRGSWAWKRQNIRITGKPRNRSEVTCSCWGEEPRNRGTEEPRNPPSCSFTVNLVPEVNGQDAVRDESVERKHMVELPR